MREVAADLGSGRDADLVGQSRSHVGLMDDGRNLKVFCGQNHRNGHKSAFGEDYIRAVFL